MNSLHRYNLYISLLRITDLANHNGVRMLRATAIWYDNDGNSSIAADGDDDDADDDDGNCDGIRRTPNTKYEPNDKYSAVARHALSFCLWGRDANILAFCTKTIRTNTSFSLIFHFYIADAILMYTDEKIFATLFAIVFAHTHTRPPACT